jgi:hypothetical protein
MYIRIFIHWTFFSMQEREENMNIKGQKEEDEEESESIVHI